MVLLKLPPLPAICINLLRTCVCVCVRILDFSPATVWYFGYSGHNIWCYGFVYTNTLHMKWIEQIASTFHILCICRCSPVRRSIHTANVLCTAQKSDKNFCCRTPLSTIPANTETEYSTKLVCRCGGVCKWKSGFACAVLMWKRRMLRQRKKKSKNYAIDCQLLRQSVICMKVQAARCRQASISPSIIKYTNLRVRPTRQQQHCQTGVCGNIAQKKWLDRQRRQPHERMHERTGEMWAKMPSKYCRHTPKLIKNPQ